MILQYVLKKQAEANEIQSIRKKKEKELHSLKREEEMVTAQVNGIAEIEVGHSQRLADDTVARTQFRAWSKLSIVFSTVFLTVSSSLLSGGKGARVG